MRKFTENPEWMGDLIQDLNKINDGEIPIHISASDGIRMIQSIPEDIEDKLYKLITDDFRGIDFDARQLLESHGFKISPGDRDSFGWLTAVIRFPKLNAIFVWG